VDVVHLGGIQLAVPGVAPIHLADEFVFQTSQQLLTMFPQMAADVSGLQLPGFEHLWRGREDTVRTVTTVRTGRPFR